MQRFRAKHLKGVNSILLEETPLVREDEFPKTRPSLSNALGSLSIWFGLIALGWWLLRTKP